ncbi:hypothetical protein [Lentibacter sp. XHP0401]|uniref:hypothetical protein n=1 Tax=Lentibacter sp. XHP0401 TaxID=2984334 RepID=UPI0021E9A036|nr:hypothetical protein [Lentibacter sp. XHP0401]
MNGLICRHLRVYFVVLLLAVASVTSAVMMAPDRNDVAFAQLTQLGLSLDDICGDFPARDHRCPYCHLLTEAQIPSPAGLEARLLFTMAWKLATDIYRAAQARDHARSPRAPPDLV